MNKKRILAIDPGTRNIGVAFFVGKDLRYFGVKTIPHLESKEKELAEGKKIITELINDFRPNILSAEKTYFENNKSSELLNSFCKQILVIGRKRNLQVVSMAANTIRKSICRNGVASKEDVAKMLASRYKELKSYLSSDRRWKERYYKNMFDAIALGYMLTTE